MRYAVISPDMREVETILDDGGGPTYNFCYYVEVEARTKREAKIAAVKHSDFSDWVDEQRGDRRSPFTGLRVEELRNGMTMGEFKP